MKSNGSPKWITFDIHTLREFSTFLEAKKIEIFKEPMTSEFKVARDEFQRELLRQTIRYAYENVPYYRMVFDRLNLRPGEIQDKKDLMKIPVLTKELVFKHQEDLISKTAEISTARCTSGTTGRRLPILLSKQELEAMALLTKIRSYTHLREDPPIVLRVFPAVRRLYAEEMGMGNVIVLKAIINLDASRYRFNFDFYDFLIQCLLERFPIPGKSGYVKVLWVTPPFLLRAITEGLKERNIDPKETHVRTVACSGGIVTSSLRNFVRIEWNAELYSSYSLSEINGSSLMCRLHDVYHFGITSIPEVVNPKTLLPVKNGEEGILLLTSLYPFQQAQPMIRYWTGDLFTFIEDNCDCGFSGPSGIFRGRAMHCIDLGDNLSSQLSKKTICSADILEVLEQFPEVPTVFRDPKFKVSRIDCEDSSILIKLDLEVWHITDANKRVVLKEKIKREIMNQYREWKDYFESGMIRIDVELHNRGDLRDYVALYPER